MSETGATGAENARASANIDKICNYIREGLEQVSDMFSPPESASKHFREARIEILRGIREIIDHRIDRLSRSKDRGTRVAVE